MFKNSSFDLESLNIVAVHAKTRAAAILAVGSIFFAKLEFAKFALATRLTNIPGSGRER